MPTAKKPTARAPRAKPTDALPNTEDDLTEQTRRALRTKPKAARAKPTAAKPAEPTPKTFSTKNEVGHAMLAKLATSGLAAKARELRMAPYTAAEAQAALPGLPAYAAGFIIPYFDLNGNVTKFWRYRYLEPTKKGFDALTVKKELKYAQPGGTVNEVYLPPLKDWKQIAGDPSEPLFITEGELKAACCTLAGYPCIGVGGVWSFKSNANYMPLLPMFHKFKWDNRKVYVAYDSDAVTNYMVMQAENALARVLADLGALPYIVRLPPGEDGAKVGLDDYILAQGSNALQAVEALTDEDTAEPWLAAAPLHKLNTEVVYIRDPGIVLELKKDGLKLSPRAFVDHSYSDRSLQVEIPLKNGDSKFVEKSAAAEWLKWPARGVLARMVYQPGAERIVDGAYNTWNGWGCAPAPGNIAPWHKLMDFLFKDAEPGIRQWMERWLAYPLQHPGTKMFSAPVIWGLKHGTGKSLLGYTMFDIYGKNCVEIHDHDLHESDNSWAENKQFVLGDEITGGNKRQVADRMKAMITQKTMRINIKYVPKFEIPDCINYMFVSNHPDSFFMEDNDRRYMIHEVTGEPLPFDFYNKVYTRWLKEENGAAHLFHYLLNLDLGDFNPAARAPDTQAKKEMMEFGQSDVGSWVRQLRDNPDNVLRLGGTGKPVAYTLWTAEDLHTLYDPEGQKGRVTAGGLARELKKAGFDKVNRGNPIPTGDGKRQYVWAIRAPVQSFAGLSQSQLGERYQAERALPDGRAKKQKF